MKLRIVLDLVAMIVGVNVDYTDGGLRYPYLHNSISTQPSSRTRQQWRLMRPYDQFCERVHEL
jgi:hypothetical protein